MPGCPIIRIEKHKGPASLIGAMGHHARTIPTKNADPEKRHENQVLWGTDNPQEVVRLVGERTDGLVKRKDNVRAVELFLGASDDFWESGGDWSKLARAHLSLLKREFGEANIIGCGVHLDENKPHLWAVITPITPDGRLAASHWFDGPAKMAKLLDRAVPDFEHLGMVRGKAGVKATHVDMQTVHDANAGNPRAHRQLTRELSKRENAAKKRVDELEAAALEAEARAAKAKVEAAEAEARCAALSAQKRQADAREAHLMVWQQRLEKLERGLHQMRESLIEAFGVLPSKVQDKLASIFGVESPNARGATTPPLTPKKSLVEPSGALPGVVKDEEPSPKSTTPNRRPPGLGK